MNFKHRANHRQPWTSEEIQMLRDLVAHEKSVKDIADTLGRSHESVSTRVWKLKRDAE